MDSRVPPENDADMSNTSNVDGPSDMPVKDEPAYGNGHGGDPGQPWNEEHESEGHMNHYDDAQMEQDLPPVGIKEDG